LASAQASMRAAVMLATFAQRHVVPGIPDGLLSQGREAPSDEELVDPSAEHDVAAEEERRGHRSSLAVGARILASPNNATLGTSGGAGGARVGGSASTWSRVAA